MTPPLASMPRRELRAVFDYSFHWLCKAREHHPPHSDIWDLRRSWPARREEIIESFRRGEYQLSLQQHIHFADGEAIDLWSSHDALALKVLTYILRDRLLPQLSPCCRHVKGHGGLKAVVRETHSLLPEYPFVCKTDVASYYDSIDHRQLLLTLHGLVDDPVLVRYVWQYLNRHVDEGGNVREVERGIPRGSSLSPLMGAVCLLELDRAMEQLDVRYVRYMDDILILAKTRWKLKRGIGVMNRILAGLGLEKRPEKTWIGRTETEFDFLGYRFGGECLQVAEKTVVNFLGRALRLYGRKLFNRGRLGGYLTRWLAWTRGGLWEKPCIGNTGAWVFGLLEQLMGKTPKAGILDMLPLIGRWPRLIDCAQS